MKRAIAIAACALAGCSPARRPAATEPALIGSARAVEDEPAAPAANARPARAKLQLELGNELSCARLDGRVHCWRLGQTPVAIAKLPPVSGIEDAIDIAVGGAHACAVTATGRVLCWGSNHRGQLGAGIADASRPDPIAVAGIEGAGAISSSLATTCALLAGGTVACWGDNDHGQTGSDVTHTADANDLVLPARVAGISGATALAVAGITNCAVARGAVWCWGRSQLASEKRERKDQAPEPSRLAELSDVEWLVGKDGMFCAVRRGEVLCWGSGAYNLSQERVPSDAVRSFGIRDAASVAIANSHACALSRRGELTCFGVDFNGPLGRGVIEQTFEPKPPEPVSGLGPVRAAALGDQTSCAIGVRDELWCWGVLPMGPRAPDNPRATPARVDVW